MEEAPLLPTEGTPRAPEDAGGAPTPETAYFENNTFEGAKAVEEDTLTAARLTEGGGEPGGAGGGEETGGEVGDEDAEGPRGEQGIVNRPGRQLLTARK